MAQTIFKMNEYQIHTFDSIESDEDVNDFLVQIENYINTYDFESNNFETFIACFPNDHFINELEFESALWKFLQKVHNFDDKEWDDSVSDNPESHEFSFSIKGKAFYVVGMHPKSSRLARQAPYPTIVFNLHWQFEKLREMGIYQNVKKRIRRRDKKLQGSINPVLKDFGRDTEAKQYSGRAVGKEWRCPFHSFKNIKA